MILLALNSIRSKAIGPDGISIQQLRGSPVVLERLQAIFRISLRDSHVPQALKAVRITPVPKCNKPTHLKHIRPIAIASTVLKILEKVVAAYINEYAERTGAFHGNQYGFRTGFGIDMAILHLLEYIRSGYNKGFITLALFVDLRRAFECIPHSLILAWLIRFGVDPAFVQWFECFLSGRTFTVAGTNGLSSERTFGSRGVPQGSGLASLLFLIVIDSLL